MKSLLRRSLPVPGTLRSKFEPHERLLALADAAESVVVGTQLALWLPTEDSWSRLGWNQIVKATWTDSGLEVTEGVSDGRGVVGDLPPLRITLSEPRKLPAVVRQRVEMSIARWEQIRVPGGTARLVARRVPGQDGLVWTGRIDTGTADTAGARDVIAGHLQQIALRTAEAEGT